MKFSFICRMFWGSSLLVHVSVFHCPVIFYCSFIHSTVDGHLGCLNVSVIMNTAPINSSSYKFLCGRVFISLRYVPRSRIAGSSENSKFNLLRDGQTVRAAALLYIPISTLWRWNIFHILSTTCFLCPSNCSRLEYKEVYQCGFDLYFRKSY